MTTTYTRNMATPMSGNLVIAQAYGKTEGWSVSCELRRAELAMALGDDELATKHLQRARELPAIREALDSCSHRGNHTYIQRRP